MVLQKGRQLRHLHPAPEGRELRCNIHAVQPGQTLSAGAKIYANQEVYIGVTVPEGYTLVAVALTNASFTQDVKNKDESLKQDGERYKLTAPNDTKSYDLNVLAIALPEGGSGLTQGSQASLILSRPLAGRQAPRVQRDPGFDGVF